MLKRLRRLRLVRRGCVRKRNRWTLSWHTLLFWRKLLRGIRKLLCLSCLLLLRILLIVSRRLRRKSAHAVVNGRRRLRWRPGLRLLAAHKRT